MKRLYQLHFESNKLFLEQNDWCDRPDSGNEINPYSIETAVQSLNKSLQSVGESPAQLKATGETSYATIEVAKFQSVVRKESFGISSDEGTSALPAVSDFVILQYDLLQ